MIYDVCVDCGHPINKKAKKFCVKCKNLLCTKCGYKLLCKVHYDQLPPDAQTEMKFFAKKEQFREIFGGINMISMLICLIIAFIEIIINKQGFIGIFCLFLCLGSAIYMAINENALEDHLSHQTSILQKQNILMQYPDELQKCSVCGQGAPIVFTNRAGPRPFRCKICKRDLCPNHYFEGFCPEHSNSVSKSTKLLLFKNERLSKFVVEFSFILAFVGVALAFFAGVLDFYVFALIGMILIVVSMIGLVLMSFFFMRRETNILEQEELQRKRISKSKKTEENK